MVLNASLPLDTFSVARDRYVAELIARKVTEYHGTMDDDEAAERLFQVYS